MRSTVRHLVLALGILIVTAAAAHAQITDPGGGGPGSAQRAPILGTPAPPISQVQPWRSQLVRPNWQPILFRIAPVSPWLPPAFWQAWMRKDF